MALDAKTLRLQLQNIVAQRDQAAQTFQQCVGAIAILSEQLQQMILEEQSPATEPESPDATPSEPESTETPPADPDNLEQIAEQDNETTNEEGEREDGNVDDQEQEQTPEE